LRIGRRRRRLADADSPQERSGSQDPAVEGAGRRPRRRQRSSGLRPLLAGRRGRREPGSPGERPTGSEQLTKRRRRRWLAPRHREPDGALLTGVSAPEGTGSPSGVKGPSEGVAMGGLSRSVWPRGPQSTGPDRSEDMTFVVWQQTTNHAGWPERTRNPTSGSGPRDRNVAGEQTVEGVRNSADGTCRVRQARVKRTLLPMSLKGRQTPGGEPETSVSGRR
jgi:hypothetical protein